MNFDDYPSLALSFAPAMTFNQRFPGKTEDFKINFENNKNKMMRQFNTQIKTRKERIKYLEMENNSSSTENLLYLLYYASNSF